MEELLIEATEARCNVDLLCDPAGMDTWNIGVRLRPWKNSRGGGDMILGVGDTVKEALENAVSKARNGRWETLDWAKRPWASQRGSSWK